MKLLTIDSREVTGRPGVLLDSGDILDLATAPTTLSQSQWIPHSVVSVIAAGRDGLERISRLVAAAELADRQLLLSNGTLLPSAGTALLAPVRRPGLVLIVDSPESGYIKSPNAAVGNGATVTIPWPNVDALWASPMLALVIGRPVFKASEKEAAAAIAGYTLLIDLCGQEPVATNDVPAWRRQIEARQFPGACPIGPTIVTRDEFGDPTSTMVSVRVNDVEISSGLLWSKEVDPCSLLQSLSQRHAFRPGDLVALAPVADDADAGRTRKLRPQDHFSVVCPGMIELDVTIG